jgi:hypothetical protein
LAYGNKFPLALKPGTGAAAALKANEILPPNKLADAREAWRLAKQSAPPPKGTAPKLVGEGATTEDLDVNDLLARMIDKAGADDVAVLDQYDPVFKALLPDDESTPTVTVSVPDFETQKKLLRGGRQDANVIWIDLIWEDPGHKASVPTAGPALAEVGKLQYGRNAKNAVKLQLRTGNGVLVDLPPWNRDYEPLHLVLSDAAQPSPTDPKLWYYEITRTENGKEYSLWLELKFSTAIPEKGKWPKMDPQPR